MSSLSPHVYLAPTMNAAGCTRARNVVTRTCYENTRLKFDTGSSTLDAIFHVRCSGMALALVLVTTQRNGLRP